MKLLIITLTFLWIGHVEQPTFQDALQQAQRERKQTLLVFSGSDWCRACISFKKNVLDQSDFQEQAKAQLVIFTADFPRDKTQLSTKQLKENEQLAETYNEKGLFPYLVLFDKNGKKIRSKAGGFNTINECTAWLGW